MILAASLVSLLVLGPPAPTLAPEPEPNAGELEGPALPGIEFAKPPQPDEDPDADVDTEAAHEDADADAPEPSWPTPGTAPPDGMGAITTGAILIPSAALMSWALYSGSATRAQRGSVIAVGSLMGAMGVGILGLGLYRYAKLHRWTLAYRVRATPQGGGLLAAGTVALTFGAALVGSGILALTREETQAGGILLGVGATGLAVVAPLTLVFGKRRRDHYMSTGGWYRPELPPVRTVRFAPILTPTSAGLGAQGVF
jgi:hypothetical protein